MKTKSENMARVRGSPSGSSFPAAKRVYHEREGVVKADPIWRAVNDLICSGRFKPSVSIETGDYGRFVIEDFRIRIVRKTWMPNPGYSWSETIVDVMDEREREIGEWEEYEKLWSRVIELTKKFYGSIASEVKELLELDSFINDKLERLQKAGYVPP